MSRASRPYRIRAIDFFKISGDSYENPTIALGRNPAQTRSTKREAFFLDYATAVQTRYPKILLMVTGGFRMRIGIVTALESNACDLFGLGQSGAAFPHPRKRCC